MPSGVAELTARAIIDRSGAAYARCELRTEDLDKMAIYEFECAGCGEHFAMNTPIHKHDELKNHPPTCPKCGSSQARELAPLIGYKTPTL
jgi:putative FmdB family regulatory protein